MNIEAVMEDEAEKLDEAFVKLTEKKYYKREKHNTIRCTFSD